MGLTIQELKDVCIANASKTEINSISPADVFQTLNQTIDTLNGLSKWSNVTAEFMQCKNFAPLNAAGAGVGLKFDKNFGGISGGGGQAFRHQDGGGEIHFLDSSVFFATVYNTADLYIKMMNFPSDEDPADYCVGIYRQSNKSFKGKVDLGAAPQNRFSAVKGQADRFSEPSSRPNTELLGRRTYKKFVGMKSFGHKGWVNTKPDRMPLPVSVDYLLAENQDSDKGKWNKIFSITDFNQISFSRNQTNKHLRLKLWGKKVASKSMQFNSTRPVRPTGYKRSITFVLPIEVRLMKKGTFTDELVKTLHHGNLVVKTVVPCERLGYLATGYNVATSPYTMYFE